MSTLPFPGFTRPAVGLCERLRLSRRFPLGTLVMTRGVNDSVAESVEWAKGVLVALRRHAAGDWGELCDDDKRANDEALEHGGRLLSAYTVAGEKVWIITESDRSATTTLRPEEY